MEAMKAKEKEMKNEKEAERQVLELFYYIQFGLKGLLASYTGNQG